MLIQRSEQKTRSRVFSSEAKLSGTKFQISYFTDGSASPNPGPGGFAVIKNGQPYIIGSEPENSAVSRNLTTNIRMEGFAILVALNDFLEENFAKNQKKNPASRENKLCELTTDSEFWLNVLTKWAPVWSRNGWRKKGGAIKNLELVREIYELYSHHSEQIKLTWTRGHVGTELNELANIWANRARELKISGTQKIAALNL